MTSEKEMRKIAKETEKERTTNMRKKRRTREGIAEGAKTERKATVQGAGAPEGKKGRKNDDAEIPIAVATEGEASIKQQPQVPAPTIAAIKQKKNRQATRATSTDEKYQGSSATGRKRTHLGSFKIAGRLRTGTRCRTNTEIRMSYEQSRNDGTTTKRTS